ncbi:hypothetical protein LTR53_006380 [Teratosphaeriaceae sp. CCFEE 6253]|nr:hypothetical protein LTR53_006380 [Teratosphaeriaceae sp. CCFEE 6253]
MAGPLATMVEGTRKRKRVSKASNISSSEGDDDGRKRGRPRVEKQDESAADRRRTQIRMAQRAYRQRKESTLEDLRKRVSELNNTLELMNQAFTGFRARMSDTATEAQLLDLRETSTQYELLMKAARNPDEDDSDLPQAKQHPTTGTSSSDKELRHRGTEPINVPSWLDQSVLNETRDRTPPDMVGMGYTMFVPEPLQGEEQLLDFFNTQEQSRALVLKQPQSNGDDALSNLLPDELRLPRQLPTITTYSFQETTFGRRLHRSCLEAAYHVLLDGKRRQSTYERVFKLSLMGNDVPRLTASLKTMLSRGVQESLDFYEAPLIHVGGAGTHYPRRDINGILQTRKSAYNLGLVGPQTLALLENAAKNNLSTDMTVEIAGYEGEWFDPYDVEGYLEERGIHIDPNQSFVEAEIDDSSSTASSSMPATPPLEFDSAPPVEMGQTASGLGLIEQNHDEWADLAGMTFTDVGYSDTLTGDWMRFLEPGTGVNWLDNGAQTSTHVHTAHWNSNATAEVAPDSLMQSVDHTSFRPPQRATPLQNHRLPRKKNIIIDTGKLVKVLSMKAVCLGRTPGYKRQDVDQALAMASFDL